MANMNFGVNILPKANNTYTLGNSDYKWNIFANTLNGTSVSTLLSNMITDIQINETSIINNGIANIPIMSNDKFGVAKTNGSFGISISNDGTLITSRAQISEIKAASNVYRPITPDYQHYSVFYGLAKAAGDSTQSASSNAVGTYTSQAQSAIRNMLAAAPKSSPFFTGAISLGRYRNNADQSDEANTIGFYSIAVGNNIAATGESSQAFGQDTYAVGWTAHAEGRDTAAYGNMSHTEGIYTLTEDGAWASHAEGSDTIANTPCVHVGGQYNSITDLSLAPTWTANTSYAVGDIVKHEETNDDDETYNYVYRCITANNDATFDYEKWITWQNVGDFAEIIGNGGYINDDPWTELRSNARALDWQGNEYLNGDLYINCNSDSSGGTSITEALNKKISITSDTVTGNPCTFNSDVEDIPLKSVKLEYEFSQSGSGDSYPPGGGKNKFDKDAVVRRDGYGIEYDGTERATETAGYTENFIPVKPSTLYTYSGSGMRLPIYYNENKEFLSREAGQDTPFIFSTSAYTHYIRIQYRLSDVDMSTWQLEEGSSATTYAPYSNIRPITGINSFFTVHSKKNMANIRGYSAASQNYPASGTLTNDYGTIISTVDSNDSVTITQSTTTTDYSKSHFRNGYFFVLLEPYCAIDNHYYDVSIKITNIVNNPLDASLSDIRLVSPGGSEMGVSEIKDNTIIFKNFLYKEGAPVPKYSFAIRNCGMSYTASEFMITPANTNDGMYEPYDGAKLDVVFPVLGKNLCNAVSGNDVVFNDGSSTTYNNYSISNGTMTTTGRSFFGFKVKCKPSTQYAFSYTATGSPKMRIAEFETEPSILNNSSNYIVTSDLTTRTFTTSANAQWLACGCYVPQDSAGATMSNFQLEEGSSATTYEPYNNSVYGGSLELTTGVLTLTHAEYKTTWGVREVESDIGSNVRGRFTAPVTFVAGTDASTGACSIAPWSYSYSNDSIHFYNHNNYTYIFLPEGTSDNTEIQIVGTLANPITIQLTPQQIKTFKGTNTIWANTNSPIEIKNYIDLETIREYADNAAEIQDVQINGTSILNNKIANIPIADTTTFGVMKIGDRLGLSNDNKIYVRRATADQIKAGTTDAAMISAQYLNNATFYGLAKAAGDSTQSASSNAVGVYTDSAKVAIQKMLGIYSAPWEVINEETFTNAEEADYTITTDSSGNSFELTDIRMVFELPKLSTGDVASSKGNYGQVWFYFGTNDYLVAEPGAFSRNVGDSGKGCWYFIEYKDNMVTTTFSIATTSSNANNIRVRYNSTIGGASADNNMGMKVISNFKINKIVIKGVTGNGRYKLYGKRKWT